MDFNIEIRRKQLESLNQFISSSKDRVDSILECLGWDAQKITENQKEMVKCTVNPMHRIPASSSAVHMQTCLWKKEGYTDKDLPLSEPNPIPGSTIIIDDAMKIQILNNALMQNPQMRTGWRTQDPIPHTSDRLLSTFTPDERLALYNFAVTNTAGPPEVSEFNIIESRKEEKKNLSSEELKALERDAKRRRIKYKAKSVHTNHKSATEVLREVIEGQMEQYEEWVKHEANIGSDNAIEQDNNSLYETGSQLSSRSQNSYRSYESRRLDRGNHKEHRSQSIDNSEHRADHRSHSKERSRDRSRSKTDRYRDEKYYDKGRREATHRNEYRSRRDPRRWYDDRGDYAEDSEKYASRRRYGEKDDQPEAKYSDKEKGKQDENEDYSSRKMLDDKSEESEERSRTKCDNTDEETSNRKHDNRGEYTMKKEPYVTEEQSNKKQDSKADVLERNTDLEETDDYSVNEKYDEGKEKYSDSEHSSKGKFEDRKPNSPDRKYIDGEYSSRRTYDKRGEYLSKGRYDREYSSNRRYDERRYSSKRSYEDKKYYERNNDRHRSSRDYSSSSHSRTRERFDH